MKSNEDAALKTADVDDVAGSQHTASPTTVGDLYRTKLTEAKWLRELAEDSSKPDELRIHLRARACTVELYASDLAHCIAWFGDGELKDYAAEGRVNDVRNMTYQGCNPWARALSVIQDESGEVVAASSPRRSA